MSNYERIAKYALNLVFVAREFERRDDLWLPDEELEELHEKVRDAYLALAIPFWEACMPTPEELEVASVRYRDRVEAGVFLGVELAGKLNYGGAK